MVFTAIAIVAVIVVVAAVAAIVAGALRIRPKKKRYKGWNSQRKLHLIFICCHWFLPWQLFPLLTMMTAYSSGIGKYTWASGGSFVDFFLGFKRGALILLGAVIIILFCAAQWMRVQAKAVWTTKNQKIVLILLAVFWGVTAISALLADEKNRCVIRWI